jgi:hypothetical protein
VLGTESAGCDIYFVVEVGHGLGRICAQERTWYVRNKREKTMNRSDVTELYYITPIENVPSIMKHGILSHNLSSRLSHSTVAMPEMQDKRKNKRIPGAGMLHDYANLYFDAHNPMLCKRQDLNDSICVLRIEDSVLDLPNVIVADRNAAKDYARFYSAKDGLVALDKDKIYARYWTNARDQYEAWDLKAIKCAEVLILNRVEPKYILGSLVANQTALESLRQFESKLPIEIKNGIFF